MEDAAERESIRSKSKYGQQNQIDSSTLLNEFNADILEEDKDKMDDVK